MLKDQIEEAYFEWMYNLACGNRYSKNISHRKLLSFLHEVEFIYLLPMDENRARDGIDLRRRFSLITEHDDILTRYLDGPCSVLEMLVSLSIRCEESIMDDPSIGDRTTQWFWGMIVNLGLGSMTDERFDIDLANDVIFRFLNREYEPDGRGGLFTIHDCPYDLRTVEIWYQMNWYLDYILGL